jgi:hypothetical protein
MLRGGKGLARVGSFQEAPLCAIRSVTEEVAKRFGIALFAAAVGR